MKLYSIILYFRQFRTACLLLLIWKWQLVVIWVSIVLVSRGYYEYDHALFNIA